MRATGSRSGQKQNTQTGRSSTGRPSVRTISVSHNSAPAATATACGAGASMPVAGALERGEIVGDWKQLSDEQLQDELMALQRQRDEALSQGEALRGAMESLRQYWEVGNEGGCECGHCVAVRHAKKLLDLTPPVALEALEVRMAQETLAYLRDLWWPSGDYPGCGELTAAGLWGEINRARDQEKERVRAEERAASYQRLRHTVITKCNILRPDGSVKDAGKFIVEVFAAFRETDDD